MSKEVQEEIIAGADSMNVADRRVLRARIGGHHNVTFFLGVNKFLCDVALDHFVREIPAHCLATNPINFKTLLERQTAGLETDVH